MCQKTEKIGHFYIAAWEHCRGISYDAAGMKKTYAPCNHDSDMASSMDNHETIKQSCGMHAWHTVANGG